MVKQDVIFYDLFERQRSRLTTAIHATNKDDSNNEYFQVENSLDSDDEVIFELSSILNVQDNVNANPVNENPVDENVIHDTFSEIYDDRDRDTVDSQSDTDTDRIEIDEEEALDKLLGICLDKIFNPNLLKSFYPPICLMCREMQF